MPSDELPVASGQAGDQAGSQAAAAPSAIDAAKAAMDRKDWLTATRLCTILRANTPDKPHGYVWGAKAAHAAGDAVAAEALFREALRRFPADPWPREDWLAWLQAQRRWQETETEAAAVMQRVDPAGRLYRAAFVAQFRAMKVLDESAIGDESIRTAIDRFGANETIIREVIDLCVSRRDVGFALRWWTELHGATSVSRELLADAVKRLYPAYCLQPGAEVFVSWLFATDGRSPLAFPVISTVRYLMNSTDVPRHVRGLLKPMYDSHEPASLDNLIRAAIGPFFGDVLEEHLYVAVMIEFLPRFAATPLARNPLNNVFFFASHGEEEFPNLAIAATRVRAAFAAAVRYFLEGNLRLPEDDREVYQLLLIADLISTET